LRRFLKDPLAHFMAAGILLFAIGDAIKPAEPASESIIVDRAALLDFIQYRSKAFEPNTAAAILDGFDDAALERLIADYVREEALAREAAALGLDANDYVIRQRMVQKVEFLAEAGAAPVQPTEADIARFYNANSERYRSPSSATLTHVFISVEEKAPAAARVEAETMLARLRRDGAGFVDATRYGDRFLFHKNYVDRTDDYINSQLGPEATAAAFGDAPPGAWAGPYRSQYGEHLIFVSSRTPARLAPLREIADLVRADLVEERRQAAIDEAIDRVVGRYRVEIRLGENS
jgi:parvulin-like peptidyl-prolyl isomerase